AAAGVARARGSARRLRSRARVTTRWTWLCAAAALGACSPPRAADIGELDDGLKVCAHGATTPGVDVSHYDGTITWPSVKGAGIEFAFMKATESTNFVDPQFAANWSGAGAS